MSASAERVTLHVGERTFNTNVGTLHASTYFMSLFSDSWADSVMAGAESGHVVPIDRDGDTFELLLRFMRQGPACLRAILPADTDPPGAFISLLLEAEYFGVEALLQHVKHRAIENMTRAGMTNKKPSSSGTPRRTTRVPTDPKAAATLFDAETGGTAAAIEAGVLPACYFAPPSSGDGRDDGQRRGARRGRIRQLVPATTSSWFTIRMFPPGDDGMDPVGHESHAAPHIVRRVACYALVELPDGETAVEPVLMLTSADVAARAEARAAQNLASMVGIRNVNTTSDAQDPASEHLPLERSLMLASDYIRCPTNHDIQHGPEVVPHPTIDNSFCLLTATAPPEERGWPTAELH